MILVLNDPNSMSDLLGYSLGIRDNKELQDMRRGWGGVI